MSGNWCGCGNYETCSMCLDNCEGCPFKEADRLREEKERYRLLVKRELDAEIRKLQRLRDLI